MSRKKVDLKLENVTIEAVAAEGKALTHVDGMVVFVDFAVPGDVVDIQVFRKKKNYMEGFISRMIQPSPHQYINNAGYDKTPQCHSQVIAHCSQVTLGCGCIKSHSAEGCSCDEECACYAFQCICIENY